MGGKKKTVEKDNQSAIVIVGMGPAGIVSAIEAAKKGNQVVLIENRDYFTRTQRVKVDIETLDYIEALNKLDPNTSKKDEDFLIRNKTESTVPINELQEFLEKKLRALYPDKVKIIKGADVKVQDLNVEQQLIHVEVKGKVQSIKFSHIVGADGTRREMASKINQALGDQIGFQDLETQTRQEAHGAISLRYKPKKGLPERDEKFSLKWTDMERLQALGWEEPYLPVCYMFHDESKKHFYVAGEIPSKILKEKDPVKKQEMMVQWGKGILALQFGYKNVEENIEVDFNKKTDAKSQQENKLKVTTFPMTLQYTDTPCLEMNAGGSAPSNAFVLMGDASKNANFLLGHGANDAIRDGKKFGECLQGNQFDFEKYRKHQEEQKGKMVNKMASIDVGLKTNYKSRIEKIDENIVKEAGVLIKLASLHQDKNLAKLADDCDKALKNIPPNYTEIYDTSIQLANLLNQLSKDLAEKQIIALELDKSHVKEMDAKISKLENILDKLHKNQNKVFNIVNALVPMLANHLDKRYQKKGQLVIDKIDALKKQKQMSVEEKIFSQKDINRPLIFREHKQKLTKMAEDKPQASARKSMKKNI